MLIDIASVRSNIGRIGGLLDFNSTLKVIFSVHIKYSSFCPSATVKYISKDLVHTKPCQGMFALSMTMDWRSNREGVNVSNILKILKKQNIEDEHSVLEMHGRQSFLSFFKITFSF